MKNIARRCYDVLADLWDSEIPYVMLTLVSVVFAWAAVGR